MSVTFPLSIADFFGTLALAQAQFRLGGNLVTSETGAGEVLPAARGARLWSGRVTLTPAGAVAFEALSAKIDDLGRADAIFMVEHPFMAFPQGDPTGTILASATPTVQAKAANAHVFSVGGLPAGYAVSAGDHLSIAFGTGAARRSYHRVRTGAVVSGGIAANIHVNPPLPASVALGNAVQLLRPALKARMVPASWDAPALDPGDLVGASGFDWTQTLE